MTPERWQRIKELLGPALELDPAKRAGYLDQACGSDPTLRPDLERLLAAEQRAGPEFLTDRDILEELAVEVPQHADAWIGQRLGPYQIVEEIGTGGMGEVYRAVRADDEYRKEVAIKLVRSGQNCSFVLSRFKNERQILASLDHPNIARLLDGGTTEEGVPYFVMDLIQGERINKYCDAHKLTTTERLQHFLQVCSAVQYAHQHLVIHRDIKPGNILVTAEGVPKLLDFGIAKILESNAAADQPEQTISLIRSLTPEYASPEQVKGEPITTSSDVYSLGVVLYELLTGRSPYDVSTHTPHEISRAVCEFEPEKPSTAARRKRSPDNGQGRLSGDSTFNVGSPEKLSKRLSGDLDNIVLMALRKEPQRRYGSVEQLAQDIRRHLDHLPVIARKDTFGYRTSRFITRHKVGVTAAIIVATALMAGMLVTLREARIADRRFNDVRQLANSLIFDIHDSIQDLPGSTPARKLIVDRALQYLDSLSQESRGDLSLQRELATAYERVGELQGQPLASNLGDTPNALASHLKALKIRQQLGERPNAEWQDRLSLAGTYRRTATDLIAAGNTRAALADIQNATTITESTSNVNRNDLNALNELGSDYEVLGTIQGNNWGYAGLGDLAVAAESYKKALAAQERILNIDPGNISARRAWALDAFQIGNVQSDLGRTVEALDSFHNALDAFLSISNAARDRRRAAAVYNQMAILYDRTGNLKLCLKNHQKGLEIYRQLVSEDPKNALFRRGLAITYVDVGESESSLGRSTDGIAEINKGLTIMKAIVEADRNPDQYDFLAQMHISLADAFARVRRFSEAIGEYRTAMHFRENIHLEGTNVGMVAGIATCKVRIADAERRLGHMTAANTDFQEALSLSVPHVAEKDEGPRRNVAKAYAGLGDIEVAKASVITAREKQSHHHWEQAIQWYRRSLEVGKQLQPLAPEDLGGFNAADVARRLRKAESELGKLAPG
jgi:eukaryotic-like serine/threonine-protein kinase